MPAHDPNRIRDLPAGEPADDPNRTTDHSRHDTSEDSDRTGAHVPGSVSGSDTASEPTAGAPSIPGYEIEGVLGRGGMGVVYKARHLALKRTVALKMVLAGGHAGARLARFRTEAEAVARLQHPNIVQIHEVGAAGEHPYVALEFVEGGNLARRIAERPMSAGESARLLETLARAMQLAHSRNVVHRDLKPANILLAADGTPKISDFGLARQLDTDSGETQAGAVMGTPSYMAPEQASGARHEAGAAADVYALGAILYDCLTGLPPFKGATVVETLDQVRTQEPVPPSRVRAGVPLDLETICLKCLRKEPENRYASSAELADDLGRYLRGEPILARPAGRFERTVKWVKRNPVVTGAALVVLLAWAVGATVSYAKYRDEQYQKGIALEKAEEAERESKKKARAVEFLKSIFQPTAKNVEGGNVTLAQTLAGADRRIEDEFADQPELREELLATVGEMKRGVGRRTPQAMILEVHGTVQWRSVAGAPKSAVPQALVNLDDRFTLAPDARLRLVFLSDFHKEWLKPGREATVDWTTCEPADAVLARDAGVLMSFVRLPKGTFYMGWNGQTLGRKTEIEQAFEIAVHDVTQGQWEAVMGKNPSMYSRGGAGRNNVLDVSDQELKLFPVESVSWTDVQEFIKKLNEIEHAGGYVYRLPTEQEWEYSCRAGATSQAECSYHFYFDKPTNDLTSKDANVYHVISYVNGVMTPVDLKATYVGRPTRVGAYKPNTLGLCDMHGNVWQWCAIGFSGQPTRAARGGSWNPADGRPDLGFTGGCHAALRAEFLPIRVTPSQGFRLVRVRATDVVEPKSPPKPDAVAVAVHRVDKWLGFDKSQPPNSISGPALVLSVSGPGLDGAKAVRTVVTTSTDDAGNPLKRPAEMITGVEDDSFAVLRKMPGRGAAPGGPPRLQEFEQRLKYTVPDTVRSIKTLTGVVELLVPAKDPGSTVTASFAHNAGKPLKSDVLRAAGVEITLKRPEGNALSYEIKDPKNRVGIVEFFDAGGPKLETLQTSRGSFTFGNTVTFFVDTQLKSQPPADAVAKIYLVTDKSVVAVPFEFKDIPLQR